MFYCNYPMDSNRPKRSPQLACSNQVGHAPNLAWIISRTYYVKRCPLFRYYLEWFEFLFVATTDMEVGKSFDPLAKLAGHSLASTYWKVSFFSKNFVPLFGRFEICLNFVQDPTLTTSNFVAGSGFCLSALTYVGTSMVLSFYALPRSALRLKKKFTDI